MLSLDLQQGKVGITVHAQNLCRVMRVIVVGSAVRHYADVDSMRARDHMVVGDNVSVAADDDA